MKYYLFVFACVVICAIGSCSKSKTPDPVTPPTNPTNPVLSITDFNPKSASVGATVMITGTAFGTDLNAVGVKFGTSATVIPRTISATSLAVTVPADAQTGKIQLTVAGSAVTSADNFTLTTAPIPVPTISAFSPQTAAVGETVTITGTNFGTDINFVAVTFGGSVATKPKTVTATSIAVIVPADAQTGKIGISVNGGTVVNSPSNFTLKAPSITISAISPKTVTTDDVLKITGTQFGTNVNNVLVYFNRVGDTGLKPATVTPTEITVIVPYNAVSGKVTVWVSGIGSVTSTDSYTFLPATLVASITPASARAGEIIKINGDFNQSDNLTSMAVRFTGSANDINPLSVDEHNNMLVRVPADAQSGKVKVTKTGYGAGSSSNSFTLLPPMPAVQSGTWTQRADFLTSLGKAGASAFTVNNKAYVIGGTTNAPFDGFGTSDVWAYDPVYNAWEQKADFGGGVRAFAVAFSIGNKGYAGTGVNGVGTNTNDFWEYNPDANKWTQKANFKGAARQSAVGYSLNNTGYIGSGNTNSATNDVSTNDFYAYDPSVNNWTQIASIPGLRRLAFSFTVDGKAYVGGGLYGVTALTDLYMFDPLVNAWTAKASNTGYDYTARNASFTIGNNGYVGLGYKTVSGVAVSTNQVFKYSPSSNSWQALPNYGGVARNAAVGFAIGNIGYFGMGQPNNGIGVYKDFWAYTP